MSVIDKIIRSTLLRSRKVFLPDVGTIYIDFKSAKRISDSEIAPPRNTVAFTSRKDDNAPSVAERTAEAGGISLSQADELYRDWLRQAKRADGSIRIQGVGTIGANEKIEADGELYNLLNSDRRASVKIRKRKSRKAMTLAASAAVIAAVAALLVWKYLEITKEPQVPEIRIATQTDIPVPTTDNSMPEPQRQPQPAAQTPTHMLPVDAGTDIQVDGHIFYIIAGTFSVESNADKYIEQLQRQFSSLECDKVRLSQSRWMVSISSSADRDEAQRMLSEFRYVKPDLWIYEKVSR